MSTTTKISLNSEELKSFLTYIYNNNKLLLEKGLAVQTVNVEGKGMVFPYGSNGTSWKWASVKSRPITEEEQTNLTLKVLRFSLSTAEPIT